MKQFFKMLLASMLGFFLSLIILFFIVTAIIASLVSIAQPKNEIIKNNSALYLKLNEPILDKQSFFKLDIGLLSSLKLKTQPNLYQTLKLINRASEDEKIKCIVLDLSFVPSGLATIEEVRNALIKFKKSGKLIYAYAENYSQTAYYLATVADKIYLNPEGSIEFKGFSGNIMFYSGLLKKFEIEPQIIRHGKYKSAIEPLISDRMSDANKEQTLAYIKAIWDNISNSIAQSRNINNKLIQNTADSLLLQQPEIALKRGFIDFISYKDEFISDIKKDLSIDEDKNIEMVNILKYANAPVVAKTVIKDKIAVVYAEGSIISGEDNNEKIASDDIVKLIKKVKDDNSVKAIVLRINSPGGSALASDVILRELQLAKAKKPLVVSMGNVAASGGYYIACIADSVFASHNTVTGSIGVFGIIPNFKGLLNNKLGITIDGVKTNANADHISAFRAMNEYEKQVVTNSVERIYNTFIKHVANGRKLNEKTVDSIAQGRVWAGDNALEIKLIDKIGGLETAINAAKNLADMEEYRVVEYPKAKDPIEQILEQITGKSADDAKLKKELGALYEYYKQTKEILEMKGVQARLPYIIEIQ